MVVCLSCDEGRDAGTLHEASTLGLNERLTKHAIQLQDEWMGAKLSAWYIIAQEYVYHLACLSSYCMHVIKNAKLTDSSENEEVGQGIAFVELFSYIEECWESPDVKIGRLLDLCTLYSSAREKLGSIHIGRIHSTRLKNKILANVPDLRAYVDGRDIFLAFD